MKVDTKKSRYHEHPQATSEFSRVEIKHLRLLLRRLRFLEARLRETGGLAGDSGSGGAVFVELEVEALVWILSDVGYLKT